MVLLHSKASYKSYKMVLGYFDLIKNLGMVKGIILTFLIPSNIKLLEAKGTNASVR